MPIYGEEGKGAKVLTWAVVVGLVVWALLCVGLGVAYGILSNFTNILLAASVILTATSSILLFRWWRAEDLDPKFRILLLLLVANLLLIGVAIMVNVFVNRNPPTMADICAYQQKQYQSPIFAASKATTIAPLPGYAPAGCFSQCPTGSGIDWSGAVPACRVFVNTTQPLRHAAPVMAERTNE